MLVIRLAFPRGRALLGALLYGLFNFAGAFGLIYYGLIDETEMGGSAGDR